MKKLKALFPLFFTICLFVFYYFKRIIFIKYYPPIIDLIIFFLFFISIFQKETVIQKIARLCNPALSDKELVYTKKLTYIWCIFLIFNFLIAFISVFLPDSIWFLYNCIISYCLIGTMFLVEYIVRIILRKNNKL